MIDIKEKYALVTGSSRGIGQQIVLGLANLGCHVLVHGRTSESCHSTLQLLEKYSVKSYVVHGELSDEKELTSVIEQVENLNIPLDILYNNAAIMSPYKEDYWEHSWEVWESTFRINLYAMYRLCGAFIPGMIERGFGRVINLTSGIKEQPELLPYSTSKWAVNKLTEDLAIKMEGTPVRVNALDPGWLQTDLGGQYAKHTVEEVLPGALAPALISDDGPNGNIFEALES